MKPYYEEDGITIYHGDCREVLPSLPPNAAIVSDPPYGMANNCDYSRFTMGPNGHGAASSRKYPQIQGDDRPFDPTPLLRFPRVVLWGFNHFAARLPVGTILIWIKRFDEAFGSFLSDAEMAWMNSGKGVYCYRDMSLMGETKLRAHPTQKPINLMAWCLKQASVNGLVIDPYVGSGTTLVAAKKALLPAIGIEIEERYCEIAAKRLAQGVIDFQEAAENPHAGN